MSDNAMRNLAISLYLFISLKVVLIRNYLNIGLSNGSTGIVKEIVYKPRSSAPTLPKFVLVDFGTSYTGYSFFLIANPNVVGFLFSLSRICHILLLNWTNSFTEHSWIMLY